MKLSDFASKSAEIAWRNNIMNTTPTDLGNNDFGFSFHDETELQPVKQVQFDHNKDVSIITGRLQTVWKLIKPLLDNLKLNPEKEYIYWPNRVQKIEEFEAKLKELIDET